MLNPLKQSALLRKNYAYIREAWHTTSWLDHRLCTTYAYASLDAMEIHYDFSIASHAPFSLTLNVERLPAILTVFNSINTKRLE